MKTNSYKIHKTTSKSAYKAKKKAIVHDILHWYTKMRRNLPWRLSKDPFHIWLSEIILQQTRVQHGLPYYYKFIKAFPTVDHLAASTEQNILRLWQGLGYYSRARNLLRCARVISNSYEGRFPNQYEELLKLPGIGPYTAAAISSIAFEECRAVIDGNVYRVLSRIFGIKDDISTGSGQNRFRELAEELIPDSQPGDYNQAVMELGALICIPRSPDCKKCPVNNFCVAFKKRIQGRLPVKTKKIKIRKRYFDYYVIHINDMIMMKKRQSNDIWKGLYDFYLIESEYFNDLKNHPGHISQVIKSFKICKHDNRLFENLLTHQHISARFTHYFLTNSGQIHPEIFTQGYKFYSKSEIEELPKPVLIDNYLKETVF
jgi:A/G-specific adenine glycosylase